MPVTGLRGRQILDGDVFRNDLNITTSGSAVIRRIIAGTNITISSTGVDTGTGDVTINGNAGTVTSVGLSLPNIFSVSGSPVTSSGTLTATFVSQTANQVFAAPNGSNGTPSFRALVAADIPALTLENLPDAWVKRSVRVATTANITLSGTQTIDGIAVVAGDRVLVKDQTTTANNGIYVVAAGAWTRSADADTASEIAGAHVNVDSGTVNGGLVYDNDFKSTDTLGTTAITWFRVIDTGYGQALTKTDDTNVTLTLGGTPSTALIQPASLTLGWTGQLSVGRGGTGASTLTGVLIGNGTSAITGVTGTASQLFRRNAGNTAYEFFTHTFASTTGAIFTGTIQSTLAWNAAFGSAQIFLDGTTGNRIDFGGVGVAAPAFTTRSAGTKLVLYPQVGAAAVDYALGIASNTLWFSVPLTTDSFKWYGATTIQMELLGNVLKLGGFYWSAGVELIGSDGTSNYIKTGATLYIQQSTTTLATADSTKFDFKNQIQSTLANNTATGSGQIFLNGTTGNRIDFNINGVAAPSTTTRSIGTKLVLYPQVSATDVDYAIGIESGTLWFSAPLSTSSFKWYGGTTAQMELTNGNVRIGVGAGVGAGRLTVNAATGGTSLYLTDAVNATLYITHTATATTRFYNGAATQWLQEVGANVTIGNSATAPSKLFLYNTNDSIPDYQITHQSSGATLNTSSPIIITNLYNSGANGHNLYFTSTSATGSWEYNITKTWGGILTLGSSTNGTSVVRQFYLYDSGQLRFTNYTTTTSFTGTAVGVLAFTSDGSIITIATPGGGSGLTGSGTANYVSKFTSGTSLGNSQIFDNGTNVGIGTTTFAYSPRVALASVGTNTLAIQTTDVVQGTTGTILYIGTDATTGNTNGVIRALGTGGTTTAHLILNPAGGNVLIGRSTSSASSYILEMEASAPRVTLRATTNSSNTGYRFETKDSAGTTRTAGIYLVPDTGSLSYIGLAANDSTYAFIARANGYCGIGQTNPQARMHITCAAGDTGLLIDASNSFEILFGGSNTANIYHGDSGQTLYINTNAGPIYMGPSSGSTDFAILTTSINLYTTQFIKNANLPAGTGGTLYFVDDYTSPIAARIFFGDGTGWSLPISKRNASVTTDLFTFKDSGAIQFHSYTAWNSFNTADAQGGLYFDTSGNIMSGVPPIYRITFTAAGNFTLSNMASALQFFNNQTAYIARADLTGYRRVRLHVLKGGTAGAAGSKIILRYVTTFTTTTTSYLDIGTTEVSCAITGTNTYVSTSWIDLPAGAKGDVYVALMQSGGNGSTSPVVGNIYAEFDF